MFTLTTVFSMLEVGFSLGTTKFIAQHRAENRRQEMEATLGASVVLMMGLGLVALAVSVAIGALCLRPRGRRRRRRLPRGHDHPRRRLLRAPPLLAYGSALAGYQRYDLYNLGQAVTVIVSTVGAIAVVTAGGGVLGVAIAYAVAFVAGGIGYALLLRRLDSRLRLVPRGGSDRSAPDGPRFQLVHVARRQHDVRRGSARHGGDRRPQERRRRAPFAAANKLQTASRRSLCR